jgi:Pyruvate/2-oxoacid:ferredoxin oxidoreductase gamma subunit
MLGALLAAGLAPLTVEQVEAVLGEMVPGKHLAANRAALRRGMELVDD